MLPILPERPLRSRAITSDNHHYVTSCTLGGSMKLLSLCLAVTTVLALRTNAAPDQKESCRKFVGEFYVWYLKHSNGGPLDKAIKLKKANFSPQLLRALEED